MIIKTVTLATGAAGPSTFSDSEIRVSTRRNFGIRRRGRASLALRGTSPDRAKFKFGQLGVGRRSGRGHRDRRTAIGPHWLFKSVNRTGIRHGDIMI